MFAVCLLISRFTNLVVSPWVTYEMDSTWIIWAYGFPFESNKDKHMLNHGSKGKSRISYDSGVVHNKLHHFPRVLLKLYKQFSRLITTINYFPQNKFSKSCSDHCPLLMKVKTNSVLQKIAKIIFLELKIVLGNLVQFFCEHPLYYSIV